MLLLNMNIIKLCECSRSMRLLYPLPQSRLFSNVGPCGDISTPTEFLTTIRPGPLTIKWKEKIDASADSSNITDYGPFRIALRDNSMTGASFDHCILLDNIPKKAKIGPNNEMIYRVTVFIPNINCANCSLQLIGVNLKSESASCDLNGNTNACSAQYSCATLKIIDGSFELPKSKGYQCPGSPAIWPWAFHSHGHELIAQNTPSPSSSTESQEVNPNKTLIQTYTGLKGDYWGAAGWLNETIHIPIQFITPSSLQNGNGRHPPINPIPSYILSGACFIVFVVVLSFDGFATQLQRSSKQTLMLRKQLIIMGSNHEKK